MLLAVGAVLAGAALWQAQRQPRSLARALDAPAQRTLDDAAITAAVAGRPDALSPLGAQAWLVDELGPAAAHVRITIAATEVMRREHPDWGGDLRVAGPAIHGTRTIATVHADGPLAARVITFADERARTAPPSATDRAGAAATNLSWEGASSLARRVARPLGLAVGAIRLAAGLLDGAEGLAGGARAGDLVVCRQATVTVRGGPLPGAAPRTAWRTAVLRDGRVILDAVAASDPCRVPTDG